MKSDSAEDALHLAKKQLSIVLLLVAVHSFSMGIGLIVQPVSLLKFLGFGPICENFFPAQGGTFHILMSIAYLLGAGNIEKYDSLIVFSIIVKSGAALFLTAYCIIVEFEWFILFCGIIDAIMGLAIFLLLLKYSRYKSFFNGLRAGFRN
jgi:hypothetical protein